MMKQLCDSEEITESGSEFRVSGAHGAYYVMIFRQGERLVAYQNVCPHRHLSLSWAPGRFMVGEDGLLVCPHHAAVFNLDSGECLQGPCSGDFLLPVSIEIRDGQVWLENSEDA